MSRTSGKLEGAFGSANTGVAWLSSARVVRCWVKSRNERNPHRMLAALSGPLLRNCRGRRGEGGAGVAWLSSARGVRCWVKSRNERNPHRMLAALSRPLLRNCPCKREEGGDDVKSAWPLRLGLHTCYNGRRRGTRDREVEAISQTRPQFGSQAATRLREAGIASNRRSAKLR